MSDERLLARGRLVGLMEQNYAILVEIRTLAEDIRRKVPAPEEDSTDITAIKGKEAQVLLTRLIKLQEDFNRNQGRIDTINEEYGFTNEHPNGF